MYENQSELPSLPSVVESDLDHVPGVEIGTQVKAYKIDPDTGKQIGDSNAFVGMAYNGVGASEGGVYQHKSLYVLPPGRSPHSPSHTSGIERIDKMSDGSYWLKTPNSMYRLEIVEPSPSKELEENIGCFRRIFQQNQAAKQ